MDANRDAFIKMLLNQGHPLADAIVVANQLFPKKMKLSLFLYYDGLEGKRSISVNFGGELREMHGIVARKNLPMEKQNLNLQLKENVYFYEVSPSGNEFEYLYSVEASTASAKRVTLTSTDGQEEFCRFDVLSIGNPIPAFFHAILFQMKQKGSLNDKVKFLENALGALSEKYGITKFDLPYIVGKGALPPSDVSPFVCYESKKERNDPDFALAFDNAWDFIRNFRDEWKSFGEFRTHIEEKFIQRTEGLYMLYEFVEAGLLELSENLKKIAMGMPEEHRRIILDAYSKDDGRFFGTERFTSTFLSIFFSELDERLEGIKSFVEMLLKNVKMGNREKVLRALITGIIDFVIENNLKDPILYNLKKILSNSWKNKKVKLSDSQVEKVFKHICVNALDFKFCNKELMTLEKVGVGNVLKREIESSNPVLRFLQKENDFKEIDWRKIKREKLIGGIILNVAIDLFSELAVTDLENLRTSEVFPSIHILARIGVWKRIHERKYSDNGVEVWNRGIDWYENLSEKESEIVRTEYKELDLKKIYRDKRVKEVLEEDYLVADFEILFENRNKCGSKVTDDDWMEKCRVVDDIKRKQAHLGNFIKEIIESHRFLVQDELDELYNGYLRTNVRELKKDVFDFENLEFTHNLKDSFIFNNVVLERIHQDLQKKNVVSLEDYKAFLAQLKGEWDRVVSILSNQETILSEVDVYLGNFVKKNIYSHQEKENLDYMAMMEAEMRYMKKYCPADTNFNDYGIRVYFEYQIKKEYVNDLLKLMKIYKIHQRDNVGFEASKRIYAEIATNVGNFKLNYAAVNFPKLEIMEFSKDMLEIFKAIVDGGEEFHDWICDENLEKNLLNLMIDASGTSDCVSIYSPAHRTIQKLTKRFKGLRTDSVSHFIEDLCSAEVVMRNSGDLDGDFRDDVENAVRHQPVVNQEIEKRTETPEKAARRQINHIFDSGHTIRFSKEIGKALLLYVKENKDNHRTSEVNKKVDQGILSEAEGKRMDFYDMEGILSLYNMAPNFLGGESDNHLDNHLVRRWRRNANAFKDIVSPMKKINDYLEEIMFEKYPTMPREDVVFVTNDMELQADDEAEKGELDMKVQFELSCLNEVARRLSSEINDWEKLQNAVREIPVLRSFEFQALTCLALQFVECEGKVLDEKVENVLQWVDAAYSDETRKRICEFKDQINDWDYVETARNLIGHMRNELEGVVRSKKKLPGCRNTFTQWMDCDTWPKLKTIFLIESKNPYAACFNIFFSLQERFPRHEEVLLAGPGIRDSAIDSFISRWNHAKNDAVYVICNFQRLGFPAQWKILKMQRKEGPRLFLVRWKEDPGLDDKQGTENRVLANEISRITIPFDEVDIAEVRDRILEKLDFDIRYRPMVFSSRGCGEGKSFDIMLYCHGEHRGYRRRPIFNSYRDDIFKILTDSDKLGTILHLDILYSIDVVEFSNFFFPYFLSKSIKGEDPHDILTPKSQLIFEQFSLSSPPDAELSNIHVPILEFCTPKAVSEKISPYVYRPIADAGHEHSEKIDKKEDEDLLRVLSFLKYYKEEDELNFFRRGGKALPKWEVSNTSELLQQALGGNGGKHSKLVQINAIKFLSVTLDSVVKWDNFLNVYEKVDRDFVRFFSKRLLEACAKTVQRGVGLDEEGYHETTLTWRDRVRDSAILVPTIKLGACVGFKVYVGSDKEHVGTDHSIAESCERSEHRSRLIQLLKQNNNYFIFKKEMKNENIELIRRLTESFGKISNSSILRRLDKHFNDYAITRDNLTKMLFIMYRLKTRIPVIMESETGVGKTYLISYLMHAVDYYCFVLHVDSETTPGCIDRFMAKVVERLNKLPRKEGNVIFFDEFNTAPKQTIALIKEILCDGLHHGEPIPEGYSIIAAMNPHRKLNEGETEGLKMLKEVKSLENLAYRVNSVPGSIHEESFDFGSLDMEDMKEYVGEMVKKKVGIMHVEDISNVIRKCHQYVADCRGEESNSAVSLRDVRRYLYVYTKLEVEPLKRLIDWSRSENNANKAVFIQRLLIAAYICYASKLTGDMRKGLWKELNANPDPMRYLRLTFAKEFGVRSSAGVNIALNDALTENLLFLFICKVLMIPILIVGSPGSSKSLALRILIEKLMQTTSNAQFIKDWHTTGLVEFFYQCSKESTEEAIKTTISRAKMYLSGRDRTKESSIVVLEEVGLTTKLKALHSELELLDRGLPGEDEDVDDMLKKVPVNLVGLSNWALDPAQMNRTIILQRKSPTNRNELYKTAKEMAEGKREDWKAKDVTLRRMSMIYEFIMGKEKETNSGNPYYGLRDFYSSIKIMLGILGKENHPNSVGLIWKVVKRNFSSKQDLWKEIVLYMTHTLKIHKPGDLKLDVLALLRESLEEEDEISRHIMVITDGYSVLDQVRELLEYGKSKLVTIVSSRFPGDDQGLIDYDNTNLVATALQKGLKVLVLFGQSMFPGLYDVLNKHYEKETKGQLSTRIAFGAETKKFVVKSSFRLITMVSHEEVKDLSSPLLNRFEKHDVTALKVVKSSKELHQLYWHLRQRVDSYIKEEHTSPLLPCFVKESTLATLVLKVARDCKTEELRKERATNKILQVSLPEGFIHYVERNKVNPSWFDCIECMDDVLSVMDKCDYQRAILLTYEASDAKIYYEKDDKEMNFKEMNFLLFDDERQFINALAHHSGEGGVLRDENGVLFIRFSGEPHDKRQFILLKEKLRTLDVKGKIIIVLRIPNDDKNTSFELLFEDAWEFFLLEYISRKNIKNNQNTYEKSLPEDFIEKNIEKITFEVHVKEPKKEMILYILMKFHKTSNFLFGAIAKLRNKLYQENKNYWKAMVVEEKLKKQYECFTEKCTEKKIEANIRIVSFIFDYYNREGALLRLYELKELYNVRADQEWNYDTMAVELMSKLDDPYGEFIKFLGKDTTEREYLTPKLVRHFPHYSIVMKKHLNESLRTFVEKFNLHKDGRAVEYLLLDILWDHRGRYFVERLKEEFKSNSASSLMKLLFRDDYIDSGLARFRFKLNLEREILNHFEIIMETKKNLETSEGEPEDVSEVNVNSLQEYVERNLKKLIARDPGGILIKLYNFYPGVFEEFLKKSKSKDYFQKCRIPPEIEIAFHDHCESSMINLVTNDVMERLKMAEIKKTSPVFDDILHYFDRCLRSKKDIVDSKEQIISDFFSLLERLAVPLFSTDVVTTAVGCDALSHSLLCVDV